MKRGRGRPKGSKNKKQLTARERYEREADALIRDHGRAWARFWREYDARRKDFGGTEDEWIDYMVEKRLHLGPALPSLARVRRHRSLKYRAALGDDG